MEQFLGYHSEWNLGSPGGWDYQRTAQKIGKAVWERLDRIRPSGVVLDFAHPLLVPVYGFVEMLVGVHRAREGSSPGLIAVVAEKETLEEVTENRNLADLLGRVPGITGCLTAPEDLSLQNGRVCHGGRPVSTIFIDFNTDLLLALHRRHGLAPLLQAVGEGRVINPRGTEPINAKSMFEVITGPERGRFDPEVVRRTPWTRQFFPRRTDGPSGEPIADLVEWTRAHWGDLVLKPERGYSGKGVRVGGVDHDADAYIGLALEKGDYIVQEKIPLGLWAEELPELDLTNRTIGIARFQTDFRCLMGPDGLFGFLGRIGGVPTNVGSGGGFQPLAVLRSPIGVREAVDRINGAILEIDFADLAETAAMRDQIAVEERFTYLLGPIKTALRPRVITEPQIGALGRYSAAVWNDCRTLERMWKEGALDAIVKIEDEELAIARSQPWGGSPAIIASDGLFSFGAHLT